MSRSRAKRCARSRRRRLISGSFSATSRVKAPSARSASHTSAMPPAPSLALQTIRPNAVAGRKRANARGRRGTGERRQPCQHVGGFAARMGREKFYNRCRQFGLRAAKPLEPSFARSHVQVERFIEQLRQCVPSSGRNSHSLDLKYGMRSHFRPRLPKSASTPTRTRAPFPIGGAPCVPTFPSALRPRPRCSRRSSASRRPAPASGRLPRARAACR